MLRLRQRVDLVSCSREAPGARTRIVSRCRIWGTRTLASARSDIHAKRLAARQVANHKSPLNKISYDSCRGEISQNCVQRAYRDGQGVAAHQGIPQRLKSSVEICEFWKNIPLNAPVSRRQGKVLDSAHLILDRRESQPHRLTQQIRYLQETVHVLQDSEDVKDPDPARSNMLPRLAQDGRRSTLDRNSQLRCIFQVQGHPAEHSLCLA